MLNISKSNIDGAYAADVLTVKFWWLRVRVMFYKNIILVPDPLRNAETQRSRATPEFWQNERFRAPGAPPEICTLNTCGKRACDDVHVNIYIYIVYIYIYEYIYRKRRRHTTKATRNLMLHRASIDQHKLKQNGKKLQKEWAGKERHTTKKTLDVKTAFTFFLAFFQRYTTHWPQILKTQLFASDPRDYPELLPTYL